MENASKAIIMVGGMLIAMLVVSLLVIGWNNITDYNKKEEQIETREQIMKFNKEFESYNKKVVYGYELVSLANLISDTNNTYYDQINRYGNINGYENIVAYVRFLEDTILYDRSGRNKERLLEYTDLQEFMKDFYELSISHGDTVDDINYPKIFKESYFQCDKIVYNGENDNGELENGKGSGRVQKLYFTQITRKE